MKKSWKTTVAGILLIVAALAKALSAMLDGDASTVADWNELIGIIMGAGLLSARDYNVSSEDQGLK